MSAQIINSEVVREVFKTMKYNTKDQKKSSMVNLLERQSTAEVNVFLTQFMKNDKWGNLKNEDREKLMSKLAIEIEKEVDAYVALVQSGEGVSATYVKQKILPYLVATVRYYSTFCELVEEKQKEVLVSKLSNESCLSSLGYVLGPALAAGYRVLFIAPQGLGNIIKYIELTAVRIGFPEATFSVLLDNVDVELVTKLGSVVSLFDATIIKLKNKKILSVIPTLTPIIVFDNADVDSSCDSLVNATWGNRSIFDSIAKEVFVQETVFEKYVGKLKEKVSTSDNVENFNTYEHKLKSLILTAEKRGIEVFPAANSDSSFRKTLFIGGRIINRNTAVAPCISVVAFRNVDEAIALANNTIQGLSASVWTENIGLGNYVAQKLDVSNVWINSFGIYSPDVAFIPMKLSGKGFFGGIQGFNELFHKKDGIHFEGDKIIVQGGEKILLNAVTIARKGYQSWSVLPKCSRINKVCSVVQYIESNRDKFKGKMVTEEWLKQWKILFYQYIVSHYDFSITSPIQKFNLNVSYISKGVLVAEATNNVGNHIKLLICSILEGNSLIYLNQCEQLQEFYNELSKQLPSGVFNVVPYFNGASSIALRTPLVDVYFNEYSIDEDLASNNRCTTVSQVWSDIHSKVTFVKNVWSNIGQGYLK